MAYIKQNFKDNKTVLKAEHLIKMEDAIIEALGQNMITLTSDGMVQGGYNYGSTNENTNRIRNASLIKISNGSIINYNIGTQNIIFNVVSGSNATSFLQQGEWLSGTGSYEITADGYLTIIIAAEDKISNITPDGFTGTIEITIAGSKSNNANDAVVSSEKIRKIYHFGGDGNDWCFVYLPPNYDINRAKPYPFVICNHGNGWTMDGTAAKANWTKRTMYVPLTDSDYESQPTQFNGTSDESLWYSNPTIEAFLAAGYVVCGCENYGDGLYGNDNCRNACAEFFAHMVRTYNVEDRCCMIGASNGAMTTLNACYLLGERVKAIILQYPLACLTNHYFGYSSHQAEIRKVYGISDSSITEENFIKATRTHDPMHTNMVDGKKVSYFPPTKIYYSTTDTVTKYNLNAIPLYEMLDNSLKVVEITQVDADGVNRAHGDYAHFNPTEYVEWFNKW